jgi:hypothetical protein
MASSAVENSVVGRSEGGFTKAGGVVENEALKFYSDYSVFERLEVTLDFSVVRSCQNASPWPHLFFIFK